MIFGNVKMFELDIRKYFGGKSTVVLLTREVKMVPSSGPRARPARLSVSNLDSANI